MRSFVLALLIVASTLAAPPAAAKGFAEDPAGDTQTEVFGAPAVPLATPAAEAADILSLDIVEDAEELTFALKVAKLDQQVSFSEYEIGFTWQKDEYAIYVERAVAQGVFDGGSEAYLVNTEEGNRWDAFAHLEHEIDAAAGLITVHLPKPYILSENGRYPLLGDELEDLFVEARSHATIFSFTASAFDRMPDGDGALAYPFLFGDTATGHLRLDADERVRVSNGGATTFVYQAIVENKAEFDDQVAIELTEMPEGWNGTVQSPMRIPAGSERRIAILVSVPFAHDHGGFSSFNVTVTSESAARSSASIRMGVLHTPIPQPAGHHSELYLHARNFNGGVFGELFPWTGATMNTDASHETDAPEASAQGTSEGLQWQVPLDPVLRMGLDFDVARLGEITGTLVGHQAQAVGSLRAELLLVENAGDEDDALDGLLLADSNEQDLTLDMSTPQPFKLTLTPTEEADYVPYQRGQNLVLMLYFENEDDMGNICCMPGATPALVTSDFKMTLPLNEYHDKLSGLTEAAQVLELDAEGAVEKAGLPGTTMTYAFTLANHGAEPEVIDLDLAGTDAMLGTLVPAEAVELGPKESRKITLAVAIPTGRNAGEEIEVLLFAHAQADPSKSAIARTKTIVAEPGAPELASDESGVLTAAQLAEENDTPGPGAAAALLALVAALGLARRRRA